MSSCLINHKASCSRQGSSFRLRSHRLIFNELIGTSLARASKHVVQETIRHHSTCTFIDHSTCMYFDHSTRIMYYVARVRRNSDRGSSGRKWERSGDGRQALQCPTVTITSTPSAPSPVPSLPASPHLLQKTFSTKAS